MKSLRDRIRYLPLQYNVECCTANAVLLAHEIMQGKIVLSRLYLYYMSRKLRGDMSATGVSFEDTFAAFNRFGVCSEKSWPFCSRNIDKVPTENLVYEAILNKMDSYTKIQIDKYKENIDAGIPIMVGLVTGELFPSIKGKFEEHKYKPINNTDNKEYKNHAIVCIGYCDELNGGSWIIANSAGPKWGFYGFAAIPYACNVDIKESFILSA